MTTIAAVERLDATRTVGISMTSSPCRCEAPRVGHQPRHPRRHARAAHALFAKYGKPVSVIRDSGGFVTQRVVATIVNIATDMCQQGVCTPAGFGNRRQAWSGLPDGPLAMGDRIGPTNALECLFNLQTVYGDTRYRPSPWLRRRGAWPAA